MAGTFLVSRETLLDYVPLQKTIDHDSIDAYASKDRR